MKDLDRLQEDAVSQPAWQAQVDNTGTTVPCGMSRYIVSHIGSTAGQPQHLPRSQIRI